MTATTAGVQRDGTIDVLIVDDSKFFRKRLRSMLSSDASIHICAEAENGAEALALVKTRRPNVIVMDVNMPVMDGITAVRKIMQDNPTPILMFSSLTKEGARASLDALEAGAVDFVAKEDGAGAEAELGRVLAEKIRTLARGKESPSREIPAQHAEPRAVRLPKNVQLILVGASTGGPSALQSILPKLSASFAIRSSLPSICRRSSQRSLLSDSTNSRRLRCAKARTATRSNRGPSGSRPV